MYRWLLRLFPASFRNEYGEEMCAVFARQQRDARTPLAHLMLWLRTIADSCANATLVHFDILRQDLAYAGRTLRRRPGFASTALIVVSLGVGATTAAFSVTDVVLVRPLPFPHADRLVKIWEQRPGFPRMELSPANYRDLKVLAQSYSVFGAYRGLSVNVVGAQQPLRLAGAAVTPRRISSSARRAILWRSFQRCARSSSTRMPSSHCPTCKRWKMSCIAIRRRGRPSCDWLLHLHASRCCSAASAFTVCCRLPCRQERRRLA
jgi:hypothetical protein